VALQPGIVDDLSIVLQMVLMLENVECRSKLTVRHRG
jgi:hypothetical protein